MTNADNCCRSESERPKGTAQFCPGCGLSLIAIKQVREYLKDRKHYLELSDPNPGQEDMPRIIRYLINTASPDDKKTDEEVKEFKGRLVGLVDFVRSKP